MSDAGSLPEQRLGKNKLKLKFYIFSNDISTTLHDIPFVLIQFLRIVISLRRNPQVRVTSGRQKLCTRRGYFNGIANSVYETGDIFSKEIISNNTELNIKNKFWSLYATLESTGEIKLMMNFYLYLYTEFFGSLKCILLRSNGKLFFSVISDNSWNLYLKLLENAKAFNKLNIVLVKNVSPLKTEIARFVKTFRLNFFCTLDKKYFKIFLVGFFQSNNVKKNTLISLVKTCFLVFKHTNKISWYLKMELYS